MIPLCRMLLGLLALVASGTGEDAKPEAPKLLTRFFRVKPGFAEPASKIEQPLILDGLQDNETTRASSAREFFEARGVTFPPGADAVFYLQPSLMGVTNTAENILKVAEVLRIAGLDAEVPTLRVDVRVVEYPPEVEEKLTGKMTFPALRKALGKDLKTVCISSAVTMAGNRNTSDTMTRQISSERAAGKAPAKAEDATAWPPAPGVDRTVLEVEPNLSLDEKQVDLHLSFRHATSAKAGQPALVLDFTAITSIEMSAIHKVKDFTVVDEKAGVRHYAVLVRCDLLDRQGRPRERRGEQVEKPGKAPEKK
jgi:hypothetical protein